MRDLRSGDPVFLLVGVLDQRWVERNRNHGNGFTRNGSLLFVVVALYGVIAGLIGMSLEDGYTGFATLNLWIPTGVTAAGLVVIADGNLRR